MTMFNILSPDGFTIRMEDFKTKRAAIRYFEQWKEQYYRQGFYSSVRFGRIDPEDLSFYCELIKTK